MGWAELTRDLRHVEDVQEAIDWAEAKIDQVLNEGRPPDAPHGKRVYVLYVKVPEEDRYLQISGWDPVRTPDWSRGHNLTRARP